MTRRALASYLGALVVIAWAILTAWAYLRRGEPDREPQGDVQPWDARPYDLTTYTYASGGSLDWRN